MGQPLDRFNSTMSELLRQSHNKIVLDVEEVPTIDSSGIGLLVRYLTTAKQSGGNIRLFKPSRFTVQTLKMVGGGNPLRDFMKNCRRPSPRFNNLFRERSAHRANKVNFSPGIGSAHWWTSGSTFMNRRNSEREFSLVSTYMASRLNSYSHHDLISSTLRASSYSLMPDKCRCVSPRLILE